MVDERCAGDPTPPPTTTNNCALEETSRKKPDKIRSEKESVEQQAPGSDPSRVGIPDGEIENSEGQLVDS